MSSPANRTALRRRRTGPPRPASRSAPARRTARPRTAARPAPWRRSGAGRRPAAGAGPRASGPPAPRAPPGRWRPAAARPGTDGPRPPAARLLPARCAACPRPGPGRPGGTAPRGCAAPRPCARGADHGRSPATPGIPGCARAGSSTPGAGPRPAASQVPGVGFIGLGVPFAAAGKGGVRRLGQMRRGARPRTPRPRTRHPRGRRTGQPGPQVRPVSRGDLAAPHLPGAGVEVVEGDLLPVDIQPAYDGHRDLLKLRKGAHAPHANCLRGPS